MLENLASNNELSTPKPITEVKAFNPNREALQSNGLMEMSEAVVDELASINEQLVGKTPEEIRVLIEEGEQEILANLDKFPVSPELKNDFSIYIKQIFQEMYKISQDGNITQEEISLSLKTLQNYPFDFSKYRDEINLLFASKSTPVSVPKEPFQTFTTPDDGKTPKPDDKGDE